MATVAVIQFKKMQKLFGRNAVQRRQIRQPYQDLYQQHLIKRLENELSGDFEGILLVPAVSYTIPTQNQSPPSCLNIKRSD
ncbi:hypothetical protein F3Y22_tig00110270pilonHSYRG00004 [Hibiscus syriacus]|uniref:Uncharacterized protein n=1 Tax=Hibiscus syriacus TaxID=106335 RepID=A0A6A3B6H3_HIBSY|nr:hypothetical protein F3Y22_tig00110270pilonHSYRG00004 [Hibiscus syriacus]